MPSATDEKKKTLDYIASLHARISSTDTVADIRRQAKLFTIIIMFAAGGYFSWFMLI
jgi:hypothetical protein